MTRKKKRDDFELNLLRRSKYLTKVYNSFSLSALDPLSQEIQCLIFSYLDTFSIIRSSMVCRLWNMILTQEHPLQDVFDGELVNWRQLIYRTISFGNPSDADDEYRPTYELDYDLDYQHIPHSRVRNSGGTGLSLTRNAFPHEYCDTLGSIRLNDNALVNLLAKFGDMIEYLYLNDCIHITDASLEAIAKYCTNLHTLDLTNCHLVSDIGLQFLADSPVRTTLVVIDISGCTRVRLPGLRSIMKCEQLSVFLHRWSLISKHDVEAKEQRSGIVRLRGRGPDQIILFLRVCTKERHAFSNLTSIDLSGSDNVASIVTPLVFAHYFPSLETLRLNVWMGGFSLQVMHLELMYYQLRLDALLSSAQQNTTLRHLELRGNASEFMANLPSDAFPMLESFIVQCLDTITHDVSTLVSAFVAQHPHLKEFSFLINNAAAFPLQHYRVINHFSASSQIESLYLSKSISCHADFMNFFLSNGDSLRRLHIDFISAYTNQSKSSFYPFERNVNALLGAISQHCHSLTDLRLINMDEVDWKALLVDLPLGCPQLLRLGLERCHICPVTEEIQAQVFLSLYTLHLRDVSGFLQDITGDLFPRLRHLHLQNIIDIAEVDLYELLGFEEILCEHDADLVQTPTSVNRWSEYFNTDYNSDGLITDTDDDFNDMMNAEPPPPQCLLYQLLSLTLEGIPSLSSSFLADLTNAYSIKTLTHRFPESHLQGLSLSRLQLVRDSVPVINLVRQIGGNLLVLELVDFDIREKIVTLPRYCPILRELHVRMPRADANASYSDHDLVCSEIQEQIPHIRQIKLEYL
jgi:hypothetical protein